MGLGDIMLSPEAKEEFILLERRAGEDINRVFEGKMPRFPSVSAAADYVSEHIGYALANNVSSVMVTSMVDGFMGPNIRIIPVVAAGMN